MAKPTPDIVRGWGSHDTETSKATVHHSTIRCRTCLGRGCQRRPQKPNSPNRLHSNTMQCSVLVKSQW